MLKQITGFFDLASKNLIGIDIGKSGIKLAQIKGKAHQPELAHFISIPFSEGTVLDDEIRKYDEVLEVLKEAYKKGKFQGKKVALGLFGPNIVSRKLQLEAGSPEEIENQVIWESDQYLPFDVDDAMLSYDIVTDNQNGGKDVIFAAARRDVVNTYETLLQDSQLSCKVVDLNMLALCNAFEFFYAADLEKYSKGALLLDIGAQTTGIIIYKEGFPVFCRELDIAADLFTEEIQKGLGVSAHEAEELKKSSQVPEQVLTIIEKTCDRYLQELNKIISFHINNSANDTVPYCFITGGGGQITTLRNKLADHLKAQVQVIDPLEKIKINLKNFTPEELDFIKARGVVSIGLALRSFDYD